MPVEPITYVYLVLAITSFVIMCIAAIRRDVEKALTFFICFMMFALGFSANYQICPLWFCAG
jgi:hypothetical protein